MYRRMLVKLQIQNTKFNENFFSCCQVLRCRQTDLRNYSLRRREHASQNIYPHEVPEYKYQVKFTYCHQLTCPNALHNELPLATEQTQRHMSVLWLSTANVSAHLYGSL
jgi:hypothetical protein